MYDNYFLTSFTQKGSLLERTSKMWMLEPCGHTL